MSIKLAFGASFRAKAIAVACLFAVAGVASAAQAQVRGASNANTMGKSIHIGPSQGRHIGHEAGHVVQQRDGRRLDAARHSRKLSAARKAETAADAARTAKAAKAAKTANNVRKAAKIAAAGTGVGAVVGIGAGLAGVDPVEMATLKATNPAEYKRRMAALKKNPAKYMGDNIKNNTTKGVRNVAKATGKVGCGVGNAFKKKADRGRC